MSDVFCPIDEAIGDLKQGKMIIIVDDEDRENEGDLMIAAEKVTPEAINFMAKYGRGLICLALTGKRTEELGLTMMVEDNQSAFETPFTISIDAREGVTTGISAADRAKTIQVAIDPKSEKKRFDQTGSYFPFAGQGWRRSGAYGANGSFGGYFPVGRIGPFWRYLRNHE